MKLQSTSRGMSSPSPAALSTVLPSEEILAHPRFAEARKAFVEAVLALHEGDQFRSRLLSEAMRQVTFNTIVSLHLRHDVTDRSTWPTLRRLKDEIRRFGLASPRRIFRPRRVMGRPIISRIFAASL